MIDTTPEFKAALEGAEQLCMADLYTITAKNGITLRQTTADADLYVGGFWYDSNLVMTRGTTRLIAGVEIDTLDVTLYPMPENRLGALPLSQGVRQGILDGADFLLERAFYTPTFAEEDYIGKIIRFAGKVSDIEDFTRSEIPIKVKSHLEVLNTLIQREIYQPGCRRILYGPGCDLAKESYGTNATATAGTTAQVLYSTLAGPERTFVLGTITMTSGANSGESRTVKNYCAGVFTLTNPLPVPPAPGDTFRAYAGCDRQMTTCSGVFNNLARFSGEPFIPPAETAY